MELNIIKLLAEKVKTNRPACLVTVIASSGSTPAKIGAMMVVDDSARIGGTVGGGKLEHWATHEAIHCLNTGENKEIVYHLPENSELGSKSNGEVRLFIRAFYSRPQLVIVGAGHIGQEVYKLGIQQGYQVVVIDNRETLVTKDNFPEADRIITPDLGSTLSQYHFNKECYVTIAASTHELDCEALHGVINADVSYIGMIGSTSKITAIFKQLLSQGVRRERLAEVYAPMGLNIASVHPREIALSIMSEILLVKNNGSAEHMRSIKNISLSA